MSKSSPNSSLEFNRITSKFQELRDRGEGALVTYLTGADPDPDEFIRNVSALVEGGTDVVEIGIPFSDPIADGPVIQASSQRALSSGATPRSVLSLVKKLSAANDVPFVILTYYNPILRMGADTFCRTARESGADGLVVVDLPSGEDPKFHRLVLKHGMAHIPLVAPNTPKGRLERIIADATGFVYVVSLYGVTGPRKTLGTKPLESLQEIRSINRTGIPILTGFGVSTPDHVRSLIRMGADGAIVGSMLVKTAYQMRGSTEAQKKLRTIVAELKNATRKSQP